MRRDRAWRLLSSSALVAVLCLLAVLPGAALAAPRPPIGPVEVSPAIQSDVSGPLSSLSGFAPSGPDHKERGARPLNPGGGNPADPAAQVSAGPAVSTTPGLGFDGLGRGKYGFTVQYAPPDTNGAVGATQYVQWVNTYLAVFDKASGALLPGFPKAGNAVWSGFGGGCQSNNDGDPIVRYDALAQRWILTQFSVSTTPYLQCVAVSTTSDATGSYYRYAFSYGNTQFPDYPKLGVWPDAYYVTYNIFNNGQTWAGAKVCAFDRNHMLLGQAATQQCFQLSTAYGGLLPADVDGAAPPAGATGLFLNFGTPNILNLWQMHVDFANAANTTLAGPTPITVASFSTACNGGTCIPQPGTSQKLDSLGDRLMYRLQYRNFGTYQTLVVNHSVGVGSNRRSSTVGVRWYELRKTTGNWGVYQQGTYSPDTTYRWMGSIAMDKVGNIALGYTAANGSTVYPSVRFTGRVPTDPLGTMQGENVAKAGTGSQTVGLSRWGDYSAMSLDPVDGCTFWYTSEYLAGFGTWNWNTWITSFKLPGCS